MVQSLGISVGNSNTYVAAGQGGGIEILLNEYSNRATPSMVAFTDKNRSIGVDASSNQLMNLNNTIFDIMLLLTKPLNEIDQSLYPFKFHELNGKVFVTVKYLDQERRFTITQILAMLFTKVKSIAHGASNCVISCPQFFDANQKAALLDAALIAGLNPMEIISDTAAIVLNYAYTRTTKEDQNKYIVFIDFGESNLQTCLALLNPQEDTVKILASESEVIGGRDFNKLLADYFVHEHKLNLKPKAYLRLASACEKLKRLLSANANDIPIHVESLISDDVDFSARINRAIFEQMSQHLLQKAESCFKRLLENAKAKFEGEGDMVLQVELVGGSSRIPAVKQLVQNVFNVAPSTTLNTDEAVARGCVLHCATLHIGMKVKREIKILDSESFFKPVDVSCDKDARKTELEMITNDNKYRSRLEARNNLEEYIYSERSKLPESEPISQEFSDLLDWLCSEEGEDAVEDVYIEKFNNIRTNVNKYFSRLQARNNLMTYVNSEKSKFKEGDPILNEFSAMMDWLASHEGANATETVYVEKLKYIQAKAAPPPPPPAPKPAPEPVAEPEPQMPDGTNPIENEPAAS